MAERRKTFRIEEMTAPRSAAQSDDAPGPMTLAAVMREIEALRSALASMPRGAGANALPPNDVERLASKLRLIRSTISGGGSDPDATRIARELQAVMQGSDEATQKILAAAEEIDQAANNLSAALKDASEQGLAQDIRDRVIAIFEACNFQDLTSQRVVKVMAAFGRIEQQIARTLDDLAGVEAPPRANGPRLEGDRGHVSQSDVDLMFDGEAEPA
jgi:chemotaxis protein CheZ